MKNIFALVLSVGLVTGCASVIEGQTQPIKIVTPGAEFAECHLYNKDLRYLVRAGETRNITKSQHDLTVECLAEGNRTRTVVVDSQLEPAALLNVTNGIIPGTAYDHASKALYAYPEVITVDFTGVQASAYPLPDYMRPELRNAYVGEIERYGSDNHAIQSDAYNTPSLIQKRTAPPMSGSPFDPSNTMAAPAARPLVPVTEK